MSDATDKPKIVIDEDWKSQVQAEKEAARHAPTAEPAMSGSDAPGFARKPAPSPTSTADSSTAKQPELDDLPLPPASLTFLCTTLATQAMIALGQVPNPITGKVELRLKQAKHYIDTLGMLEGKTVGNRTAEESTLFDDLLHQLRMAYVMLQNENSSGA